MTRKTFEVTITPHDSVFFSDGRRFDQDDEGLAEAMSEFPPSPHVITSVLRRRIARVLDPNWDGRLDGWSKQITEVLGGGAWNLGNFSVTGIRVLDERGNSLLPTPASVMLNPQDSSSAIGMRPVTDDRFESDLTAGEWFTIDGSDRTVEMPPPGFMGAEYLQGVLNGRLSTTFNSSVEIAPFEKRLGLKMDERVAASGMLYSAGMRRTNAKGGDVPLFKAVVEVNTERDLSGLEVPQVVPFGGRGRSADVSFVRKDRTAPTKLSEGSCFLFLATPALFSRRSNLFASEGFLEIENLSATAAATHRPVRFAPWDAVRGQRGPWTWQLPAGAVWRLKIGTSDAAKALADQIASRGLNDVVCGEATSTRARALGFGEAIIVNAT